MGPSTHFPSKGSLVVPQRGSQNLEDSRPDFSGKFWGLVNFGIDFRCLRLRLVVLIVAPVLISFFFWIVFDDDLEPS